MSICLLGFVARINASEHCLVTSSELDVTIERSHTGLVTANWSIEINNQCDAPYDGTMRVQFFTEDSAVPQETVDFIILQARESSTATGSVNLPVEDLSEISRTEVN
ncbi:MAG: hypothetical protein WD709_08610, partial [Gammaproteobacteria bacterium]